MDAAITVTPQEFNLELFKKIREVVGTLSPEQITISFSAGPGKESKEAYEARLLTAIADLKAGKGTRFTMDELASFVKE